MRKEYSWTITMSEEVDFEVLYDDYQETDGDVEQAVDNYIEGCEDVIYYTITSDVVEEIKKDFKDWLETKEKEN